MSKRSNFIFKAMLIIAWLIFVGLGIEAGGLIVNFVFSLFKPEVIGNLYQKLDLTVMYRQSKWAFFSIYSFILFISVLKAMLFYNVIQLLHKLDLTNPFSSYAANKINTIAYYTFSIGIISHVAREVVKNMIYHGFETNALSPFWVDSQAFILMAAVVYVIAQIFKRGVELQNENNLTV